MGECCCCIPLRAGCIIVGLLLLAINIAVLGWCGMVITDRIEAIPAELQRELNLTNSQVEMGVYGVTALALVSAFMQILLILGASGYYRCPIMIWLIWSALLLTAITIALLAVMAVSVWAMVDEQSAQKHLNDWHPKRIVYFFDSFSLNTEHSQTLRDNSIVTSLVVSSLGLVVCSLIWGWFCAVNGFFKEIRYTDLNIKPYVHNSQI